MNGCRPIHSFIGLDEENERNLFIQIDKLLHYRTFKFTFYIWHVEFILKETEEYGKSYSLSYKWKCCKMKKEM